MADTTQITVRLPADLVARLRATIVGIRRQGHDATIVGAIGSTLEDWCAHQEAEHNAGQPFPATQRVPAGRRISTSK